MKNIYLHLDGGGHVAADDRHVLVRGVRVRVGDLLGRRGSSWRNIWSWSW